MKATTEISKPVTKCYHCGDVCLSEIIEKDDLAFCCKGCQTVFDILNSKDLCSYYTLSDQPGISPSKEDVDRFAFLDDEKITNKLLDFQNETEARITLEIPAMHCASCIWLLEKLYQIHDGIKSSRVNFPQKRIYISFDKAKISVRTLVTLLSSLGYEPALSLSDGNQEGKKQQNRKLYYQIGVAGFCFGNVMLFSMPDYFDITGDLTSGFRGYFGFVSLLFALPVLLYADLDYFKSAIGGIKHGAINLDVPLSIGMLVLFISSAIEILGAGGPGYLDSFTGLVFFLLLGKAFQAKTFQNLSFERDFKSYFPLSVNLVQNGASKTIPLENLQVGNRILIKNNDLIPADGLLLNGSGYIDYSFVTGEAVPETKVLGEVIYAGGRQKGAAIELEIIREVSKSYLTELWNHQVFANKKDKLKGIADKVGKWFTVAILVIAFGAAIYWHADFHTSIKVFAAVLIVACPCALALSIPYTFGNTIRILGRLGFYLKNAAVVEQLAKINFIVFDKTGTLTEPGLQNLKYEGQKLDDYSLQLIKSLSLQSNHPLSIRLAQNIGSDPLGVISFKEVAGEGINGIIDGHDVRIGSALFAGNTIKVQTVNGIHISIDNKYQGVFNFDSAVRESFKSELPKISEQYPIAICSGDSDKDKGLLTPLVKSTTQLLFNQKPIDKLQFIEKLRAEGHNTMMMGDGLNDAGALQASHVGVSIAEHSSQFSPASDVIMEAGIIYKLNDILKFSQFSYKTVKASFVLSALYNSIGLYFAVQGLLTPVLAAILMPLSSVSVVLFATLATNLKAKQLNLN